MHVYLTGATGFVGSAILRALRDAGHTVRCLLRDPAETLAVEDDGVEKVKGDVTDPRTLVGTARGCEAVVHLVGIIDEQPSKGVTFEKIHVEGTRNVLAEARDAEVTHYVQMSANGARKDGVSRYQTTKWEAEQLVTAAGFDHWVILRPSLVFGDPGPRGMEFATRLAQTLVKPFPILPVFGDGTYQMQPVSVEEVAQGFAQALTTDAANGQTYCVAGKETLAFNDILDRIAQGLGISPKPKLHQPLFLARPAIHTLGKFGVLPISPDQFEMLVEGNTCDSTAFYRDFDVTFKPFDGETLRYLKQRA